MSKPKHVYLVDGSGYIFRAFHALPSSIKDGGGNQANMIVSS